MILLTQLGLIISALISPIPAPETTITLTLQMEEVNAAMVGVEARIEERDHSVVYGSCVSDGEGICVLELNEATLPDVVRGRLDLGRNGSRSFIVERGVDQEVVIPFSEFGQVVGGSNHSHDPHPTLAVYAVEDLPTLPPAEAPATAVPTIEFVVVDPSETVTVVVNDGDREQVVEVAAEAEPTHILTEPSLEPKDRPWGLIIGIVLIFIVCWGGVVLTIRNENMGRDA